MKEDEPAGRATRPVNVIDDDGLTPTQRFNRAIERRDALIRDRDRTDSGARAHAKRPRVIDPDSGE
jgi:hypothetical protein